MAPGGVEGCDRNRVRLAGLGWCGLRPFIRCFGIVQVALSKSIPSPGDLLMPGKPHQSSFPERTFTVEDGFGLDSERKGGLSQ